MADTVEWYNERAYMPGGVVHIGILFNAFVSGVVAATALALAIVLLRQPQRLSPAMRSYAWFWYVTVLVWSQSFLRYFFISLGYTGSLVHYLDVTMQTAVFFGGPPLLAYLGWQTFRRRAAAVLLAVASTLAALVAVSFIVKPDGLSPLVLTSFSAETTLNAASLNIFATEVSLIVILLLYDIARGLRQWRAHRDRTAAYEALCSSGLLVYLLLGSVDQASFITDWLVVIFRMLYAATFLAVFMLVVHYQDRADTYLLEVTPTNAAP